MRPDDPLLPPKPLPARLRLRIAQARGLLAWERFAPAYLIAAVALMLFLAGAFAGVWERIGDPWRLIALFTAIGLIGWSVWKNRHLDLPNRSAAKRRVEADNGLAHRPLDTVEDSPRVTERGWNAHLATAEAQLDHVRAPRLRPVLAERDPRYLRYLAPLLLVGAVFVGWGDNAERLRYALSADWLRAVDSDAATFEAWIDPPAYTGQRPVTLKGDALADVPEGSEFVARLSGVREAPRLRLSDGRKLRAERLGPESFEYRAEVDTSTSARLRIGNRRQVWSLDVIADMPPSVAFAEAPEADKRDRLALTYDLADDYGVETLSLRLVPLVDEGETAPEPETVDVPLRSAPVRKADGTLQPIDLSRHRWAGRKARGVLVATDGKGQVAESEPAFFTVPNKIFVEPLAKALVEQRALVLEGFADNGGEYAALPAEYGCDSSFIPGVRNTCFSTYQPSERLGRAPAEFQRVATLIDAVTEYPEDGFDDPAVYLGLREAASRLRYAWEADALVGLDEDLWNLAIRAEFGRIGSALENMRRAQEQLNAAIARRAPQREVDTLFDRYNAAVDAYMEVLREEAEMTEGVADGAGGAGGSVDEIQALLDAIEEANRIGDTEGARLALARLAELLENMKIQLTPGGGGGDGDPSQSQMSEEMRESLEELADTIGEQRDLRDDTQRAQEDGEERQGEQQGQEGEGEQSGEQQAGQGGALTERQEALRDALEGLRGTFPDDEAQALGEGGKEAGEALAEAGDAMERAAEELKQGDLEGAQAWQDEAIRQLREAGQGLAQALREQRDEREGEGQEAGASNPLGEQQGGENDPDARQRLDGRDPAQRSREILEDLRRRAAEQERSQEERDYLERLMDRF